MRIDVISIFPELFDSFLSTSLVAKALDGGLMEIALHDLREWASDRHRTVDDEPFGGGGGMVMRAQPWISAVREVAGERTPHRVLLSPQGEPLNDALVRTLAAEGELVLMCGRYEGVDDRVRELVVDREVSIGDYVLSGGEVAAMVVIEAVSRQVPGVIGLADSVVRDSFRDGLLDFPHYTRPREVEGLTVPDVLLSGDHRAIEEWRMEQSRARTASRRPDLLARKATKGREKGAPDESER